MVGQIETGGVPLAVLGGGGAKRQGDSQPREFEQGYPHSHSRALGIHFPSRIRNAAGMGVSQGWEEDDQHCGRENAEGHRVDNASSVLDGILNGEPLRSHPWQHSDVVFRSWGTGAHSSSFWLENIDERSLTLSWEVILRSWPW